MDIGKVPFGMGARASMMESLEELLVKAPELDLHPVSPRASVQQKSKHKKSLLQITELDFSRTDCCCCPNRSKSVSGFCGWDPVEKSETIEHLPHQHRRAKSLPVKAAGKESKETKENKETKNKNTAPVKHKFMHYTDIRRYMEEYRYEHTRLDVCKDQKSRNLGTLSEPDPYLPKISTTKPPSSSMSDPGATLPPPVPNDKPPPSDITSTGSFSSGDKLADDSGHEVQKTPKLPQMNKNEPLDLSPQAIGLSTPKYNKRREAFTPEYTKSEKSANKHQYSETQHYLDLPNLNRNIKGPSPTLSVGSNFTTSTFKKMRESKRSALTLKSADSVDLLTIIKKYAAKAKQLYPHLAKEEESDKTKNTQPNHHVQPNNHFHNTGAKQRPISPNDKSVKLIGAKLINPREEEQRQLEVAQAVYVQPEVHRERPVTPIPSLLLQALTSPQEYKKYLQKLRETAEYMRPLLHSGESERMGKIEKILKLQKEVPRRKPNPKMYPGIDISPFASSKGANAKSNKKDSQKKPFQIPLQSDRNPKLAKKLNGVAGWQYRTKEEHDALWNRLQKYKGETGSVGYHHHSM